MPKSTSPYGETILPATSHNALLWILAAIVLIPAQCPAQSLSFSSGGGGKMLTISSANPGSEPNEVLDDVTELSWDGT